jgi:hypothetical protein
MNSMPLPKGTPLPTVPSLNVTANNNEMLAAEKAYEFLLIIAPLRIYGSTGSRVNPIART